MTGTFLWAAVASGASCLSTVLATRQPVRQEMLSWSIGRPDHRLTHSTACLAKRRRKIAITSYYLPGSLPGVTELWKACPSL